jgi:hypothetical protein
VKLVGNKNKIHFAVAPTSQRALKWTLEQRAIGPDYCTPLMRRSALHFIALWHQCCFIWRLARVFVCCALCAPCSAFVLILSVGFESQSQHGWGGRNTLRGQIAVTAAHWHSQTITASLSNVCASFAEREAERRTRQVRCTQLHPLPKQSY